MVEISLSGSGEGPGRVTSPDYSTTPFFPPRRRRFAPAPRCIAKFRSRPKDPCRNHQETYIDGTPQGY
jgi:hypothetical protein